MGFGVRGPSGGPAVQGSNGLDGAAFQRDIIDELNSKDPQKMGAALQKLTQLPLDQVIALIAQLAPEIQQMLMKALEQSFMSDGNADAFIPPAGGGGGGGGGGGRVGGGGGGGGGG
ncbi:hypothetical protein L6R52_05710, partial [Myxococcota bacterium]|nr:hypothetical protein [Myxococcota bacterium]